MIHMNGRVHPAPTTIRATVDMTLAGGLPDQITARLSYRTMDPFAVTITFTVPDCPAVDWVCARDLLREGLALPSGAGDVRIHPDGETVVIELASPSGSARLVAEHAAISDFVRRIFDAVPEGEEFSHYSLDTELAHLV